jgi:hypothetical protein
LKRTGVHANPRLGVRNTAQHRELHVWARSRTHGSLGCQIHGRRGEIRCLL